MTFETPFGGPGISSTSRRETKYDNNQQRKNKKQKEKNKKIESDIKFNSMIKMQDIFKEDARPSKSTQQ